MPGTGKTATTLEAIRLMKEQLNFQFLHINAIALSNPYLVYTVIYQNLTGKKLPPATAALRLEEYFTARGGDRCEKPMRLILIDELDALLFGKQTILYNLFDWPCHRRSNLVVIAIANTMDLPERMHHKISSRIGKNRLVYEPYTSHQI